MKTDASEQSSGRAKAVGSCLGREWLIVWESCVGVVWLVRLYPHLGRATRCVRWMGALWENSLLGKLQLLIK